MNLSTLVSKRDTLLDFRVDTSIDIGTGHVSQIGRASPCSANKFRSAHDQIERAGASK